MSLRLVVEIAFFAAMTAVLINSDISPIRFQGYGLEDVRAFIVIMAKLLWWLHLAWAIIGFVRIYLVLEGKPNEARLLQDIVVGLVYLCVTLSALAFVFGVPIGTLVATSGVIAIVLGLALQNTLGDVFSGIALTLGRTYSLGDWILLADGTEGRVIASNWRSTQVLTGANNVVVLPNSALAKVSLTNVSQPNETHFLKMTVRVAPTRMPSIIEDVMQAVLAGCKLDRQGPSSTGGIEELGRRCPRNRTAVPGNEPIAADDCPKRGDRSVLSPLQIRRIAAGGTAVGERTCERTSDGGGRQAA